MQKRFGLIVVLALLVTTMLAPIQDGPSAGPAYRPGQHRGLVVGGETKRLARGLAAGCPGGLHRRTSERDLHEQPALGRCPAAQLRSGRAGALWPHHHVPLGRHLHDGCGLERMDCPHLGPGRDG